MEEERGRLAGKIANVHKRIADTVCQHTEQYVLGSALIIIMVLCFVWCSQFRCVFAASAELRRESGDSTRLAQQITEQQQLLLAAQNAQRDAPLGGCECVYFAPSSLLFFCVSI